MQFSTKFILFFILCVCCFTVQAQPPDEGHPSGFHIGAGSNSASPWGKPVFTAAYRHAFLPNNNLKNSPKNNPRFCSGAEYMSINLINNDYAYTQISIPALIEFYPYQNNKKNGSYRYLEVAGGAEVGLLIGAKPINSSIKQVPLETALKTDNLNKVNTFGVIRLDYGGNKLGIGVRYAIALTEKDKRFKTAQIYMRLKLGKLFHKKEK